VGAELADGEQSSGEIQAVANLVHHVSICSVSRLNLTDNKVGILCILERHVPSLDLHVNVAGQVNRQQPRRFEKCLSLTRTPSIPLTLGHGTYVRPMR
jgi:hypothetical protein